MSISLVIKKLIAGIIAILMPITTTIATTQPQAKPNRTDFHASEVSELPVSEDDFVSTEVPTEDEIATLSLEKEENKEEAAAPAEEKETPAEEEAPVVENKAEAKAAAPVATWDISDTDEDDVQMYYYDEADESFLDTITASVKALFVPITAYAETTEEDKHERGTVVIDGEGATQEMIFLNWLNAEKFVERYDEWCAEKNYYNDAYILREYVDNKTGEFTGPAAHMDYVHELYSNLSANEASKEILKNYVPTYIGHFVMEYKNFWEDCADFIPEHIIINGNVTEISFMAFGFCTSIEKIEINANVERIQTGAFSRTNITDITLPATVKEIGSSVFVECANLKNIYVKGHLESCASDAFSSLPMGSNINCDDYVSYARIAGINPYVRENTDDENATTKYNRRTQLTYVAPTANEAVE